MVEELCTRYGDLYMIWFDGGADDPRGDGPDVEPIVNKYQPNCLLISAGEVQKPAQWDTPAGPLFRPPVHIINVLKAKKTK